MAGQSNKDLKSGSLEVTPTWAFALVCLLFIVISLVLERGIHFFGKWVRKRPEKSLSQALDKMKEELILLGFISLLMTVLQSSLSKICMPVSFTSHMLPCKANKTEELHINSHSRRLMFMEEHTRRILAGGESALSKCYNKGKVPLISAHGVHQLHIFIFVLAIGHIAYSCIVLLLARLQVHGWNTWEKRAQSEFAQDTPAVENPLNQQNPFLEKHANRSRHTSTFVSWIFSFIGHFRGVTYTEYSTLRRSFIQNHKLRNNFDFHKYILRAIEDDFKKVVGIRAFLWVFVVIFVLLNVHGWYTYFWIGFIPLVLLLIIGWKLHHVIVELALEIAEEQKSAKIVVVYLRDDLFWFKKPELVIHFLHFILFQNAFELAFFFWVWTQFGFRSCFRDTVSFGIARLVIGVIMLVLSSYRTLPLYALMSQMGDNFKFGEEIKSALTSLHNNVKRKKTSTMAAATSQGIELLA